MTRETFEGAALRGEQEALDRLEAAGRALLLLTEDARGVLERAKGHVAAGKYAAAYGVLSVFVEGIAGVRRPDPREPARHRCGHTVVLVDTEPTKIREPLRSHLAKQDCPECRNGVRT